MTNQYVITEGKFDKELLEKILPDSIKNKTNIVEGMGSSSSLSLARSYYAKGENKIVLVFDSDTFDERQINEKQNFAESALKMIPSNSEMKVVIFVPELDSLLFIDKKFIEQHFAKKLTAMEYEIFKRDPKFAYVKLGGSNINKTRFSLLNKINEQIKSEMLKNSKINEIVEFLK